MKRIALAVAAIASLVAVSTTPAHAGGIGEMILQGVVGAVQDRVGGGRVAYQERDDYRWNGPSEYGYDRRDDSGFYVRGASRDQWGRAIVERYGERATQRCMSNARCRYEMAQIVRHGELEDMDDLFRSLRRR